MEPAEHLNIMTDSLATHFLQYLYRATWGCSILLFVSLVLTAGWVHAAEPKIYYVSSTGDDSNSGTAETSPWKSVAKVNRSSSAFNPGDRVLFKRGDTWHEGLRLSSSGSDANPIIVGAYGDAAASPPVLDGTYGDTISWQQVEGNLYKGTAPALNQDPGLLIYDGVPYPAITTLQFTTDSPVVSVHPGAILLQTQGRYANFWVTSVDVADKRLSGITFFCDPRYYWRDSTPVEVRQSKGGREEKLNLIVGSPGGPLTDPQGLTRTGQWYWNDSEKAVYLYSENDPAAHDVEVGLLASGIKIVGQRYLRIQDISIRGFTETAVHLISCNNVALQDLHVSTTGSRGAKVGILLQESDHCTVKDNRVESVLVNGIGLFLANSNSVTGNTILYPGAAGIALSRDNPDQHADSNILKNNTIEHGNVFAYDSGGIYFFMAGADNLVQGNTVRYGGSGELQSSGIMVDNGSLPVTIVDNTVESNSMGGIVLAGEGHTVTGNRVRYNGSGYWQSAQFIFFPVTANASDCTVRANTVAATGSQKLFMVINALPGTGDLPHDIDHNAYLATDPATFCVTSGWSCDSWLNFAAWRMKTGHDLSSSFQLVRPAIPSSASNSTAAAMSGITMLLLR